MPQNFADALPVTISGNTETMNEANRDLLLLNKADILSQEEIEREVAQLNTLLYHTENWKSFCVANEILDVNRHKIIQNPVRIERILRKKNNKPFVFTSNKN